MTLLRILVVGGIASAGAMFWFSNAESPESSSVDPVVEEQAQTDSETTIVEMSDDDEWRPPFPEKVDFFSAPQLDSPTLEATETEGASNSAVRVIGFVEVEGNQPAAILDVDGTPVVATLGQSIGGIEVVAVNDPDVTLQNNGERWSVNLFQQDLETRVIASAGSTAESWSPLDGSRHSDGPMSRIAPSAQQSVTTFPIIPGVDGDLPEVELPELDDIPELPAEFRSAGS